MRTRQNPESRIDLDYLLNSRRPGRDDKLFTAIAHYHAAANWYRSWVDELAHQIERNGRPKVKTRELMRASAAGVRGWRATVDRLPARTVEGVMAKALVVTDQTGGRL